VPADGAATLVLDPEDTAACASVLSRLTSLPHGRVVCHPTPGGTPTWLGCDLLLALGKRFDAVRAEHVRSQAWELAIVWLRAEAVEHVFILRAHGLTVRALERLRALQVQTGVHLWLVSACRGVTTAQRQVLSQTDCETMHRDAFLQRWRRVAQASRPRPLSSPPGTFPAVPGVDFPVFRAMCRRLLDPVGFAVVDRTFATALADTLRWLSTRRSIRERFRALELELDELDATIPYTYRDRERRLQLRNELDEAWYGFERGARNQLQALTSASGSPAETLVRLRAAQAGYFRFGLLLEVHVPPQALRGTAEFGPTFTADLADRLRGLCTPALAAAATLALAGHLGPHALTSLCVGELTTSGTLLQLHRGEQRVLPAAAAPLVRAQLIQRWAQGASEDDALVCRQGGTPADPTVLHRWLQQVGRRLALAIPSTLSPVAAAVSWPVGARLTLSRLPVYPLAAR
jgi:hypothetical protein